jgi:hypothetical protein
MKNVEVGPTWDEMPNIRGDLPRSSAAGDELCDPLCQLGSIPPLTDAGPQARGVEPLDLLPPERRVTTGVMSATKAWLSAGSLRIREAQRH